MKKGVIWIALSFLIVATMVLASCSSATTTSTNTKTTTSTTTTTTTSIAPTSTTAISSTTTSTTAVTTAATTTPTGNWWDSLGTPTYGGTLTLPESSNITSFDDGNPLSGQMQVQNLWEDSLVCDDWTVNPSAFAYQLAFRPNNWEVGCVALDWEFTGTNILTMHLRQNVYWWNVAPVNGRKFTANDVVFYYDRLYGLGMGYTKPLSTNTAMYALASVTASDNYTVSFNWPGVSQETICEDMFGPMGANEEAPEVFAAYTTSPTQIITNWHQTFGCGPYMITDWVDATAMTLAKNTSYWGVDERHPKNQLPYINNVKILIIPAQATALAAVRAGKIDAIDTLTLSQAQQMKVTNPGMTQLSYPGGPDTIDPKDDIAPFTDQRVRQAMQMALNLPLIASTYYGGTAYQYPSTMTSVFMTGWSYPYSQWPASLKATYDYNPTGAKALLAAAGASTFSVNCVASSSNPDLDLLQIIQSEFAAVGITINISLMDAASLNTMLRAHADTGIAFGTKLGFTFPPLMGFRHWQTGTTLDWCDINDPAWNALYAQALAAPTLAQTQALVVQGNQYQAQQQWSVSLPCPMQFAVCQPWLNGYNAQTFSISSTSGVLEMGFYCARFWINQNLKQSLGIPS
jgi:peptide/nickel transport system substrate-binding protein